MNAGIPIIVLGAGGHAKVLIGALRTSGAAILGVTDPDEKTHGTDVFGVPVLGGDEVVSKHKPGDITLVNGLGSTRVSERRKDVFEQFTKAGFAFTAVIHPSAVVSEHTEVSDAVQVMAAAVIQPGCQIGADAIINTRAVVDHDCVIGEHAHVAPGAVLGGGVHIGDGAHIGTGATVIEGIHVGAGALVAAGAVVVSNVAAGGRVAGVPAREM